MSLLCKVEKQEDINVLPFDSDNDAVISNDVEGTVIVNLAD